MTQAQAEKKRRKKPNMSGKQKNRTPRKRSKDRLNKPGKESKRNPTGSLGRQRKKTLSGQKKRQPNQKKREKRRSKKQMIQRLLIEIAVAVVTTGTLIWLASLFLFSIVKVDGYGMLPTLGNSDTVFVYRQSTIRRFDLVAIRTPNGKGTSVRRVVGLPGEDITYKQDRLYVNNEEKEEVFISEAIAQADASNSYYTEDFSLYKLTKKHQIDSGKYLVLGDNRPYSSDSRYYGLIDKEDIIGVIKIRILPFHQMTKF
ncbi:signal peptidase I [Enterococcus sp. BWM-S5]|uniref:Signal peptidase I n=1 Tax=Enterococcus larvae TaxID=2794352 RepID=A0ABS4CNJ8_9ENTE|nr:signal peptidase I [Enterococcus larvae]MBP1048109.1 signal peptidase I [Enterococcus larvae]